VPSNTGVVLLTKSAISKESLCRFASYLEYIEGNLFTAVFGICTGKLAAKSDRPKVSALLSE
jgi:hypothetical protein